MKVRLCETVYREPINGAIDKALGIRMSLAGNLKTISFADILQLLSAGKKTGVLQIGDANRSKAVAFREGVIIFASSLNSSEDMLGALLLKRGQLSKDDLERAIVLHKQSGRPLGETLVDMKVFTNDDVAECLKMQIEEIVYNLFSWPEGEFDFKDGEAPKDAPFLLELPTMSVIMEGMRRIDEWVEIQKVIPKDDVLMRMVNMPQTDSEAISLTIDEFCLLPLINGERTTPQVIDMSPIGEFPSYRALYKLIVSGYVEGAGMATNVSVTGMENEEEVVLGIIFQLYNNCFYKIRQVVDEVFGKGSVPSAKFGKYATSPDYASIASYFPGFEFGADGSPAFDRFYAAVVKIPAPIRLHSLMSSLETMLTDQLELVFRFVGSQQYRNAVSRVKKEISEPLAARRELVKRYQIDENFYTALHRAERIVKSAIG